MQDHAKHLCQLVEAPDLVDAANPRKGIRKKITGSSKFYKKKISLIDESNMLIDNKAFILKNRFFTLTSKTPT